jgi:WD40 repeat protein
VCRVKIWDMSQEGLTELASLAGHDNIVWGVALSADGSLAASAGLDGTVCKVYHPLTAHRCELVFVRGGRVGRGGSGHAVLGQGWGFKCC